MGVIEIEYELNKINVFTKSDEEPMATGLSRLALKNIEHRYNTYNRSTSKFNKNNLDFIKKSDNFKHI
jgi:hypothetical protein